MNDLKWAIALATCCCSVFVGVPSASADFVGVTAVIKDDPDTEFLCTQGNGLSVPGPLTVCNVFAVFDNPADRLFSVGTSDLQVYNGAVPDVFFQHPEGGGVISPMCGDIVGDNVDLICDSYITIGLECGPFLEGTTPDSDFDPFAFQFDGIVVGGWFNAVPSNRQGIAGNYPDL